MHIDLTDRQNYLKLERIFKIKKTFYRVLFEKDAQLQEPNQDISRPELQTRDNQPMSKRLADHS